MVQRVLIQIWMDGGFSNNMPIFPKDIIATLFISPFASVGALITPRTLISFFNFRFGETCIKVGTDPE